jgi:excisionase family DNA binding protein
MTARVTARERDLTVRQAAQRLGVSPRTVRSMIHEGKLNAYTIGTGTQKPHWRIPEQGVTELRKGRREIH